MTQVIEMMATTMMMALVVMKVMATTRMMVVKVVITGTTVLFAHWKKSNIFLFSL